MAEWFKAPVLKTGVRETVPGVRIPPQPLRLLCLTQRRKARGDQKLSLRICAAEFLPLRPQRLCVSLFFIVAFAVSAHADIYQWEYIDPGDPSQGKRQSTTLVPDGASVDAVPGVYLSYQDLTMAYLIGADLTGAYGDNVNLTDADLSQANLTDADFPAVTTLTGADFTGAEVRGAGFSAGGTGWTKAQLYSTASYQAHDLTQIALTSDLRGWNFVGQKPH